MNSGLLASFPQCRIYHRLVVGLAVGVAAFVQVLAGFGFALLSMPIMTLAIPVEQAVVVSTVLSAITTSWQSWFLRKDAETNRYEIGPKLWHIGSAYLSNHRVLNAALSYLSQSQDIEGIAVSSGVPRITAALRDLADQYLDFEPIVIEPGVRTGIRIDYDNPKEVGADRIANAISAGKAVDRAVTPWLIVGLHAPWYNSNTCVAEMGVVGGGGARGGATRRGRRVCGDACACGAQPIGCPLATPWR